MTPAPAFPHVAPVAVFEYVSPAPVIECGATGVNLDITVWCTRDFPVLLLRFLRHMSLVHFLSAKCLLLLASPLTILVSPLFSSTAVEVSASQVVGSLPLGEVFAAPVFHHVHQEQLAGGDTTVNIAVSPVVLEQGVVGSLPPAEEFTVPVFTAFHQEQFPAGEATEKFATIPIVHEQVILGVRPEPLAEPRHWFIPGLEALCPDDDGAPSLSLPSLADRAAEVVDSSSLRFLTASALEARRKEEEEAVETAELEKLG